MAPTGFASIRRRSPTPCSNENAKRHHPLVRYRTLLKLMSRELVRDQGMMLLLGSMRSAGRLATFLLNLSQRLAARGFSAHDFHLRAKSSAATLGLSLETVSRLFSRFQEEGAVAWPGSTSASRTWKGSRR